MMLMFMKCKCKCGRQTLGCYNEDPDPGPPTDEEPLLLYIVATTQAVSTALVVEREEEGHALKV